MAEPQMPVVLRRARFLLSEDAIRLAVLIGAAAFLLDWTTKSWALQHLDGGILPLGSLTLGVVRNDGFALSAGTGQLPPLAVAGLRLLVLCAILLSVRRISCMLSRRNAAGMALLLAGGLGNSADLLFRDGAVVDFIGAGPLLFGGAGPLAGPWVVFNIADVWILLGLALLAPMVQKAGRGIQRRLAVWETRLARRFRPGSREPSDRPIRSEESCGRRTDGSCGEDLGAL